MKIVLLSDTHGYHSYLDVPAGDLLIHAGDFSMRGREGETRDFLDWFSAQSHPHKVCISGNHDFLAEQEPAIFKGLVPDNVHYLEDSGVVIEGKEIWGSPITPWFHNWAFNRHRGSDIRWHWSQIPASADIVITHGPPFGILDLTNGGEEVGCYDLKERLAEVKPQLHVFGHIHECYGQLETEGTLFVNASIVNLRYNPVNAPIVLDLD
jgi:Icc-related predicted phosphoesterase